MMKKSFRNSLFPPCRETCLVWTSIHEARHGERRFEPRPKRLRGSVCCRRGLAVVRNKVEPKLDINLSGNMTCDFLKIRKEELMTLEL